MDSKIDSGQRCPSSTTRGVEGTGKVDSVEVISCRERRTGGLLVLALFLSNNTVNICACSFDTSRNRALFNVI